jgi:hypothetical protein
MFIVVVEAIECGTSVIEVVPLPGARRIGAGLAGYAGEESLEPGREGAGQYLSRLAPATAPVFAGGTL